MALLQNSDALVTAIVAVGMGAAAVIDLRTRRIPNILTATLAAIGAVDTLGGTIKTVFWDAIANAKF